MCLRQANARDVRQVYMLEIVKVRVTPNELSVISVDKSDAAQARRTMKGLL